jgi:hypothetical protein
MAIKFDIQVGGEPADFAGGRDNSYAEIWKMLRPMPIDEEVGASEWIHIDFPTKAEAKKVQMGLHNGKIAGFPSNVKVETAVRPKLDSAGNPVSSGVTVLWLRKVIVEAVEEAE